MRNPLRSPRALLGAWLVGSLLVAACAPAAAPSPTAPPPAATAVAKAAPTVAAAAPTAAQAAAPAATAVAQAAPTVAAAAPTMAAAAAAPAATAVAKAAPTVAAAVPAPATGSGPVTVGGFPSKALRIMAPANPGGGWDSTSRAVQQVLTDEKIAAQTVEVFNRGGAGGTIGLAEFINQNRGDGHTVMTMGLVMTGAILTNASPVNLSQVTPLARLTTEYEAIAVSKDSKYQTLQQLVDDFKKDPRSIRWGGGSAGGTDHILVGLIAQAVGVNPKDINYVAFSGGGELMPQLLGNQVTVGVSGIGEFKPQAEAGGLRILAVTGPERLAGTNAPTTREAGLNVELTNWRGIVGPPGMPDNQRQAWITMLQRLQASNAWKQTLQKNDWTDAFQTGDQFAAFLKQEDERVAKVLKDIGLVQ